MNYLFSSGACSDSRVGVIGHGRWLVWGGGLVAALGLAGTAAGIQSSQGSIFLEWAPNSEPQVAGYRIHVGTASGMYTSTRDVGKTTTADVTGLSIGVTYYMTITAYDGAGVESPPSEEVVLALVPALSIESVSPDAATRWTEGERSPLVSQGEAGYAGEYFFTISGPAGQALEVLGSDDMINWYTLGSTTNPTGVARITDHGAVESVERYYQILPR